MNITQDKKTFAGLGALAGIACFIGPIVGFLAAIGVGTAASYAVFGTTGLIVGLLAVAYLLHLRKPNV